MRLTIHVSAATARVPAVGSFALSFTSTPPEILSQGVVQLATTSHMKTPAAVAGSMPDTFIQLLSRVGTVALARATFGLLICVALALTRPSGIARLLPAITARILVEPSHKAATFEKSKQGFGDAAATTSLR